LKISEVAKKLVNAVECLHVQEGQQHAYLVDSICSGSVGP